MFNYHTHSRSVNEGEDLFGDGNIECTVRMFQKQHKCNEFCRWPGFGLEPFTDSEMEEAEDEVEANVEDKVKGAPATP